MVLRHPTNARAHLCSWRLAKIVPVSVYVALLIAPVAHRHDVDGRFSDKHVLTPRRTYNTAVWRIGLLRLYKLKRPVTPKVCWKLYHLLLWPSLHLRFPLLVIHWMMVSTCCSVLTASMPQEVEAIRFVRSLRKEL